MTNPEKCDIIRTNVRTYFIETEEIKIDLKFIIKDDKIFLTGKNEVNTGAVNYYKCKFDFNDAWDGLTCFAIFKINEICYGPVLILENSCSIPIEAVSEKGSFKMGVYGSNLDGSSGRRIATNWCNVIVNEGVYTADVSEPQIPEQDVWEQYVIYLSGIMDNSIPQIGSNGNWFLWDAENQTYGDTGLPSRGIQGEKGDAGADGYTPAKGVDYWTDEDKADISSEIDSKILTKQDKLIFDSTPTEESQNPVTSGGVKTELDKKVDKKQYYGLVRPSIYNVGSGNGLHLYFENGEAFGTVFDYSAMTAVITKAVSVKANAEDVYTKTEVDAITGDIETALDGIIALQDSFIGGGSV